MSDVPARAWKIFISYTGEDLRDHAQRVIDAAIASGHWLIEDHVFWPATGLPSVPECIAKVRECHALLLLSAHRRGWVPEPEEGGEDGKSICHLEWNAAAGKPRAGLLADPTQPWGDAADPPSDELVGEVQATLRGQYFAEDPDSVLPMAQAALAELAGQLEARWEQARKHEAARGVLRPHYQDLPEQYPPSFLLRAEYRVVDFYGRDKELGNLEQWCLSGRGTGVRLIVGPGGAGKTRLGAELCERMQERGWIAGFLERNLGDTSVDRVLAAGLPALIVIDYAETRPTEVRQWLDRISRQDLEHGGIRVVMVAREAGSWWEELRTEEADYQLLLAEPEQRVVHLTLDPAARIELFELAASGFRGYVEDLAKTDVPPLSDEVYADALWVLLASRAWLDGKTVATATDLLSDQIDRESRYWRRNAKSHGLDAAPSTLHDAVAAATMVSADSRDEAVATLGRLPKVAAGDEARFIALWVHDLYPGTHWLNGLQPDLLGEALVAQAIEKAGEFAFDLLRGATEDQVRRGLTVLTRAARNHDPVSRVLSSLAELPELALPALTVAQETGDPIGRFLADAAGSGRFDGATLGSLFEALPDQTTALRELAFVLNAGVVSALRAADDLPEQEARLATALNALSARLTALGMREQAVANDAEAVDLHRRLVEADEETFRPGLVSALINHSASLSEVGRREDALTASLEAVTMSRALAETRPDAFLPDLAMSLNTLSIHLGNLGRRKDALAASEEAVTIYRALAKTRPDAFLPELAMSLNNLSVSFSDMGRQEDALAAIEETVDHYRTLAQTRPDAFLPNLAGSLNNLSIHSGNLGRRKDALAACEEAVTIYRALAKTRTDAFLPDLATSLNNLSNRLSALGRYEEALAATEEAVAQRRILAKTHPDAFLPDLAGSLNNLSTRLSDAGRREDALAASNEAVTAYRQLAADRPDAFLPDLAGSLNNLSNRLSALGRHEDALAAGEKAVTIYRALAMTHTESFLPHLATSLNNLSTKLSDAGRREDALAASDEAVTAYRQLAADRPDAHLPDLAGSLSNLSLRLSEVGRRADALVAIDAAIDHYRSLADASPNTFLPHLARSMAVHSTLLLHAERAAEACEASAGAVSAITPFVVAAPAGYGPLGAAIVQAYLAACGTAHVEPDVDLVGPIVAVLNTEGK